MLSMAAEVEQITRQYRGLLLSSAINHLRLQSYEQDLSDRLAKNEQLQVIAKRATLLLYHNRYMFRTQFLLYNDAVAPDFEILCVAFFTVKKDSDTLDFIQFALITPEQWRKATLTDQEYRSFDMKRDKLCPLNLIQQENEFLSLAYSSDSIASQEKEILQECDSIDVPASQFRLFWLHESFLIEDDDADTGPEPILPNNEYLVHYTAFLFDVYVWQRYFTEWGVKLKKRMLQHYSWAIKTHHNAMTLLFISQMIEQSSQKLTSAVHKQRKDCLRYHDWFIELSETRLYKQWLQAELFLFKEASWHKDLAQESEHLKRHISYVKSHLPRALYPNWFAYTLESEELYWKQESATLYRINGNWLFKPEFNELLQTLPLEKGMTKISTQIFQTVFMPALYRCLLEDGYQCLFYAYYYQEYRRDISDRLYALRRLYHYDLERFISLEQSLSECNLSSATSIFDCVASLCEGHANSPAVKKMVKKRHEFDLSKKHENSRVPWYERVIVRQDMPDIEELGDRRLAPPCMTNIFRTSQEKAKSPGQPRLGHSDKLNIVQYLIDLAYTKQEVIHFLGQGWEQDAAYLVEIANHYDSFSRKKRLNADQRASQHHSFYCSSIINTVPIQKEKNWLRCPYADAACAGSVRRNDFDKEEKEAFMLECGKALSRPSLYGVKHPVQWTLNQLNS